MARQLETAARWRNKSQLQAAAAAAAVNLQPLLLLPLSPPPPSSLFIPRQLHCWLSFNCLPVAWHRLLPLSSITKIKIALRAAHLCAILLPKVTHTASVTISPACSTLPHCPPLLLCFSIFQFWLLLTFFSSVFCDFCSSLGRRKIR